MKRDFSVVNPATKEVTGRFVAAGKDDVAEAVQSARRAFPEWKMLGFERRAQLLHKVADYLEGEAEAIAEVITREMGRVRGESVPEVTKSAVFFRYFADHAAEFLAPEDLDLTGLTLPEKRARILREPRGVVAVVKPWNAPVQQVVWAVAPALSAGCCVIIKPSEYTPESGLALQAAFDQAGFPEGVVQTVVGDGATGELLVNSDVDVVAFTGSVVAGRKVAQDCGRRLRKAVLELSGKDSLIVDPSVSNLDLVAAGIVYGAFSNCGQWCSSVERVFIPSALWDELVPRVVAQSKALRVGAGWSGGVDMGPIANERQFEIVSSIVQDAVDKGAKVLCGGSSMLDMEGFFFQPTVLCDVPKNARLATENVFGPVVELVAFENIDEAIAGANSTNYGLGLSVWTDDASFAEYVTRRSDTGMVWVNEPLQSFAPCPWSVVKDSGIGSELGCAGMREFTYDKVVQEQLSGNDTTRRPWYFPYA